jgi:hypothetical protein
VVHQTTYIVPRITMCRIIENNQQNHFFDFIHTEYGCRRKGFCTSLLCFVLSRLTTSPELDIRKQATVMKRIATLYGYEKIGRSDRYEHCEKWIRTSYRNGFHPWYNVRILKERNFTSRHRQTSVLYLAMEPNPRIQLSLLTPSVGRMMTLDKAVL